MGKVAKGVTGETTEATGAVSSLSATVGELRQSCLRVGGMASPPNSRCDRSGCPPGLIRPRGAGYHRQRIYAVRASRIGPRPCAENKSEVREE